MLRASKKAKDKIKVYYSATAYTQAGTYYGMAILLDHRHKSDTWSRPEWQPSAADPYNWEEHYWKELKELYDRDYAHIQPAIRRREVPSHLCGNGEINLDSVMDVLNNMRDPLPSTRPEREVVSDGQKEFDDYRSWSKLLLPGSSLVVTNAR